MRSKRRGEGKDTGGDERTGGLREEKGGSQTQPLRTMDHNPWAPGFFSSAGSNVEGSTGADSDPMSFYSTTAATTWKDPGIYGGARSHA